MARSQVQYGSQGGDVKEMQTLLNKEVDAAKNNANKNTVIAAPTGAPLPTAPTYDSSSWGDTEKGQSAWGAYNDAKDAVNNHGDFQYANQAQLDAIMNSILNGGKFSYDFNEDALYHMYKDKYIKQGKMAMADTMGQAAAMTGGYGNSYAATVGNQAYQASLEQLNDVIPELYQMAFDRYSQERQDLYNQYGMLADDYERGYGQHQDKYNKLLDSLGIARDDYYDGADMFYSEQDRKNRIAGQTFNDAMSIWNANNTNAWNEAQWNRDQSWRDEDILREQTWRDEDIAYQKSRDAIADSQWQKQFDAVYGNKSAGGSGGTGGGSGSSGGSSGGYTGGSGSGSGSGGGNGNKNTGNGGSGNTNTGAIPDAIRNKAASFTDNDALDAYLTSQYNAGKITKEQMGELYLENEVPSLKNRNWTLVDGGGVNWLLGIDNNAVVKDQYGKTYRLDKLVDALVAEGMSKSQAKDYVKKLQKELGA